MPSYLVVDDSPAIRLVMVAALKRVAVPGAEIVEASTDEEALRLFLDKRFDVVFLDMMLDEAGSSLHILKHMLRERPDARVVLVTGLDREHADVVAAISQGAFAHLRKPIRSDDIQSILAQIDAEDGRGMRIR